MFEAFRWLFAMPNLEEVGVDSSGIQPQPLRYITRLDSHTVFDIVCERFPRIPKTFRRALSQITWEATEQAWSDTVTDLDTYKGRSMNRYCALM